MLVNCMSIDSPLKFRKSREVSLIFSKPCRSNCQSNPRELNQPPRLDRVKVCNRLSLIAYSLHFAFVHDSGCTGCQGVHEIIRRRQVKVQSTFNQH